MSELRIPCVDMVRAQAAADMLRMEGVNVARVDGALVLIEWGGSAMAAWDAAEVVVRGRFAFDDVVAHSVDDQLREFWKARVS